jgi:negative regulator of sigma E activity
MAESEYARGVADGEITARLREHDAHFGKINGSMGDVADSLRELALQVQRLADAAEADRTTAITLAAGLKEADQVRRNQGENRWAPLSRLGVVATVVAAIIGLLAYLATRVH